jgi:hypothetical protein
MVLFVFLVSVQPTFSSSAQTSQQTIQAAKGSIIRAYLSVRQAEIVGTPSSLTLSLDSKLNSAISLVNLADSLNKSGNQSGAIYEASSASNISNSVNTDARHFVSVYGASSTLSLYLRLAVATDVSIVATIAITFIIGRRRRESNAQLLRMKIRKR